MPLFSRLSSFAIPERHISTILNYYTLHTESMLLFSLSTASVAFWEFFHFYYLYVSVHCMKKGILSTRARANKSTKSALAETYRWQAGLLDRRKRRKVKEGSEDHYHHLKSSPGSLKIRSSGERRGDKQLPYSRQLYGHFLLSYRSGRNAAVWNPDGFVCFCTT